MGFLTDSTITHGASLKAFNDAFNRFHFFDGNTAANGEVEFQQATQRYMVVILNFLRIFLVQVVVVFNTSLLQQVDSLRIVQMRFAVFHRAIESARIELLFFFYESAVMTNARFKSDAFRTNTTNAARRVNEIFVDEIIIQADGFENLCAVVASNGGNTHLGHNLQDTAYCSLDVVSFCLVSGNIA